MSQSNKPWIFAGATDIGRVRARNEDSLAWDEDAGLLVLADGMGGYAGGDVASAIAVDAVMRTLTGVAAGNALKRVRASVGKANREILEAAAKQPEYQDMGTTLVLAWFRGDRIVTANVGDSRVYRLRGGELSQLTVDHTVVQEQIAAGLVSEEEARFLSGRGLLTQAVGVDPEVEADIREEGVQPGDLYLLCSDGFYDMLGKDEIAAALAQPAADLDEKARELVRLANEQGGYDNISVLLARIVKPFPAKGRREKAGSKDQ